MDSKTSTSPRFPPSMGNQCQQMDGLAPSVYVKFLSPLGATTSSRRYKERDGLESAALGFLLLKN